MTTSSPGSESKAAPSTRRGTRVMRAVRVGMGVLALWFVGHAARGLVAQWENERIEVAVIPVLGSLLPLAMGTLGLALGWKWLLERMTGGCLRIGPTTALHLGSQLARYVPGKMGVPVIRIAGASRIGVAVNTIGASVFIETLSLVAVGGAFSFTLLALTREYARGITATLGDWALPLTVVFVLVTLVLLLVDRRRFPQLLVRAIRAEGSGPLVPAVLPLVHVSYWVLWAVHGYVVSRAVGADHAVALASTSLYSLAPIVGFLVLVAPAGIGVREALLTSGLAPAVGPGGAVAAALISRAASLAGDVILYLGFRPFQGQDPADAG